MQLKNTITLNLKPYALRTDKKCHLFKSEPIFASMQYCAISHL